MLLPLPPLGVTSAQEQTFAVTRSTPFKPTDDCPCPWQAFLATASNPLMRSGASVVETLSTALQSEKQTTEPQTEVALPAGRESPTPSTEEALKRLTAGKRTLVFFDRCALVVALCNSVSRKMAAQLWGNNALGVESDLIV